ncbi:SEC-C metal-binding domain-containing protein [Desulfobacterium sp. N47]|uniref:SEC-C motif domain protein n=1 Tax=uncultured Desulfobacterium sp. TaxID=201089 RepID=E1YMT4_9BACT|nr:unknown protein [uncultured Desulfobacterium sp.]
MATFALRFSDDLKEKAQLFSKRIGLSLNAVIIVALDEYLRVRTGKKSGSLIDSVAAEKSNVLDSANTNDLAQADVLVSRNAPCSCGSGKKYKKCCGSYQITKSLPGSPLFGRSGGTTCC